MENTDQKIVELLNQIATAANGLRELEPPVIAAEQLSIIENAVVSMIMLKELLDKISE